MLEQAKAEIRAIFANEVECVTEGDAKLGAFAIFERTIVLKLRDGRLSINHVVYGIHPDGYWEQIAARSYGEGH